jgi:DNA-binding PadR family transcriptional regulator
MRFDPRDYDDDARGRDSDDARSLGRGPGSDRQTTETQDDASRDYARWADRERDDPRGDRREDAFTRHVALPRGPERERVLCGERTYTLRGSEVRTLATVGAFRVVSCGDLQEHRGGAVDPRQGDLRHLREQGLIETVRVPGSRDHAVALTKAGQDVLERYRDTRPERRQAFHAGLVRGREREHDLHVHRAYRGVEARLEERGARVERVVLDHELKSEYQRWRNGRGDDQDDQHERTLEEVRAWAADHDLPFFDNEVHFPDVRVEYQEPDGRWGREDVEVMTPHYRGAHAASVARAGFSTYRVGSLRLSGGRGGGSGRPRGLAEELL